jgi:hypothetical protein
LNLNPAEPAGIWAGAAVLIENMNQMREEKTLWVRFRRALGYRWLVHLVMLCSS